jgi:hypothetical protein
MRADLDIAEARRQHSVLIHINVGHSVVCFIKYRCRKEAIVPSPPGAQDVEYWKKRAEEARSLAEEMHDANTRILMLGIAESYEQIAKSHEKVAELKERSQTF